MKILDINCDIGENKGDDAAVIKYINSANIACGGHAGDGETIKRTIELACAAGVRTGAHPGYTDPGNFGRIETGETSGKVIMDVMSQLETFSSLASAGGSEMSHVKFHGALYNRAASDYGLMFDLAKNIISGFGPVPIFTLAGSVSEAAVREAGGIYVSEGFADRAYDDAGSLIPRHHEHAVIHDTEVISRRVMEMVSGNVMSVSGKTLRIDIRTICVHGDTPGAVAIAAAVHETLHKRVRYEI